MRKIRVLESIRQGKIGGGETYLMNLAEHMDKSLFEPVVLAFTDGPMIERMRRVGIEAHVIYTEKPFDVRVWKKVRAFLTERRIDIVQAHGTRAVSNLFWAAGKLGIPMIYTNQGWSFHPGQHPLVKRFRLLSEGFLTSRMDVNVCGCVTNRDTGRQMIKGYDAEVIYNPVDKQRFNARGRYRNLRPELGLAADDFVIGWLARFTKQKQPLKMITAFAKVAERVPKARLIMIGEGELKEQAHELVKELGLSKRVSVLPSRQDVPEVLAAMDVYVLPSLWEGLPLGLLEAMAMGKPVVASAVDGSPEVVRHMESGILVDVSRMEEQLVEALTLLHADGGLREKLSVNAIKTIDDRFDVKTMTLKNEEIFQRLAATDNR